MAGSTTTGRRLGRYHLGEPLGGGPCGEVYRAKVYGVAGFERQFAVKRFHPELVATPVVPQRLSTAARAYGSLEHPRIARLHEYGVAGGEVFTATEMVAGLDVMRLIAATHGSGAPLPPGAALALATQAARAIGYAHGRGLAHLGICPTNVIVTPDGDVKITDFGMLAQTLTMRACDDPRLVHRIHHLAPEQLVGEAASAASDVFALGALIHELVTGERAFVGVTPLDVEHAILSGHVREAGLPKTMGRVMARCFARSPYERFPDARALADAIDAALRVTPVSGGRRELGALVKDAVARLDAMNEGQLSGAMMLAMPMPPSSGRTPAPKPRSSTRGSDQVTALRDATATTPPPTPPVRDKPPTAAPRTKPATSSPATRPSMGQLPAWGGAPAPAPPTIVAGPATPAESPRRNASPTRPPPITPPALIGGPNRIRPTQPPPLADQQLDEDSQERTLSRDPSTASMSPSGPIPAPPSRVPNASPLPFATPTPDLLPEAPPEHLTGRPGVLRLDSAWPTGESASIPEGSEPIDGAVRPSEPFIEMRVEDDSEGVPVLPSLTTHRPQSTGEVVIPPSPITSPPPPEAAVTATKKSSSAAWMILFLLFCSAAGVGAVLGWNKYMRDDNVAPAVAKTEAPSQPTAKVEDKQPKPPKQPPPQDDVVKPPVVAIDAGVAVVDQAPPDAAAAQVEVKPPDPVPDVPVKLEGDLKLTSDPSKALVYVDGKKAGKTPYKHEASGETHTVAVVVPGHALWLEDIALTGERNVELAKIKGIVGNAGIKVKCRHKKRYYVFVDGQPSGEICPTKEIRVEAGDHVVEIYDLEERTRKQFPIAVKESRNSFKLVVD